MRNSCREDVGNQRASAVRVGAPTGSARRGQDGDEETFCRLVAAWGGAMLRLARAHVQSHQIAEDVVQDAWLTVLRSLDRFERRSSLRTWVLGIVVNLARSRARSERRSTPVPFDREEPAVDLARFRSSSSGS